MVARDASVLSGAARAAKSGARRGRRRPRQSRGRRGGLGPPRRKVLARAVVVEARVDVGEIERGVAKAYHHAQQNNGPLLVKLSDLLHPSLVSCLFGNPGDLGQEELCFDNNPPPLLAAEKTSVPGMPIATFAEVKTVLILKFLSFYFSRNRHLTDMTQSK